MSTVGNSFEALLTRYSHCAAGIWACCYLPPPRGTAALVPFTAPPVRLAAIAQGSGFNHKLVYDVMASLVCRSCGSLLHRARWMSSGITYDAGHSDVDDLIEANLASARHRHSAAAASRAAIACRLCPGWLLACRTRLLTGSVRASRRFGCSPRGARPSRSTARSGARRRCSSGRIPRGGYGGRIITATAYTASCWSILLHLVCRRDVLRESARQEFEAARFEDDPEIVGSAQSLAAVSAWYPLPNTWP